MYVVMKISLAGIVVPFGGLNRSSRHIIVAPYSELHDSSLGLNGARGNGYP